MYSKSQSVSPKSNGFLTAIPSSISAPSLLLLQQPLAPTSRKYNTMKSSSKDKKKQNQQNQQPQISLQLEIQSTTNTVQCNNTQNNSSNSNSNSNRRESASNSSGKNKFHKKINFLNKEKNNNSNNGSNNNKHKKSNINKSSIIITNDYIINDMGLTSTNNIINNLKSVSIHADGKVEIDKSIKKEVLATSNDSLRTSIDKTNKKQQDNNDKEKTEIFKIDDTSSNYSSNESIEEEEEIYPFSMNEETLNEYFNFLSILSDYIDHQITDDDDSKSNISTNSNSSNISNGNNIFSVFNVDQVPEISIYDYILRIFKYLPFGTDIFIFSIIYLDRVIQQNPNIQISYLNIHRLFMASVLVASKYHNDKSLNNRYYAQVGGVTLSEMNLLEINFLILIDWQLLINPNTFNSYNELIQLQIKSLNKNELENLKVEEINNIDNDFIQNHNDNCNIANNNSNIYQQPPTNYQYQQNYQYSTQVYTNYPQQQFYNNNNNNKNNKFKRNISKNKVISRPNYLTYPIPSNQYHLYTQYYQQPIYTSQNSGSYDDNNVYYDYNGINQGYNTQPNHDQASNYMVDSFHYQQQQQQSWLNGSYYYHQQTQSSTTINNHYHR